MSIGELVRRKRSGASTDGPSKPALSLGAAFGPGARPLVGGAPRVSLLPPELHSVQRAANLKRRALIGVVGTVVVVAIAVGGAGAYAMSEAAQVSAAAATTSSLGAQIAKYASVQKLEQQVALGTAAERVGTSTAIDWQSVLGQITGALPSGFRVTSMTADSASAIADYTQGSTPLEGQRVATIVVTTHSTSIAQLPTWLTALTRITGYADESPVLSGTPGNYTVTTTIHMTDAAYITPLSKGTSR